MAAVFREIMKISFECRRCLEGGPALGKVLENPRAEKCSLPGSAGMAVLGCPHQLLSPGTEQVCWTCIRAPPVGVMLESSGPWTNC